MDQHKSLFESHGVNQFLAIKPEEATDNAKRYKEVRDSHQEAAAQRAEKVKQHRRIAKGVVKGLVGTALVATGALAEAHGYLDDAGQTRQINQDFTRENQGGGVNHRVVVEQPETGPVQVHVNIHTPEAQP